MLSRSYISRARKRMKYGKGLNPRPYHGIDTRAGKRDRLDELCRQIVKLRDQACVTCGTNYDLQCGHFLSRTSWSTRFHLMNVAAQCSRCNAAHENNPEPFRRWMEQTYEADEIAELERLWHVSRLFSDAELDEMISDYEETIRVMKGAA